MKCKTANKQNYFSFNENLKQILNSTKQLSKSYALKSNVRDFEIST